MKKGIFVLILLFICLSVASFGQTDSEDESSESETSAASSPTSTAPPATASKPSVPVVPPVTAQASDTTAKSAPPVASPAPKGAPLTVKVNMFVQNIGKFDPVQGKYTAEFEVELKAPENTTGFKGEFEILNGRVIKKEEIETDEAWNKHYKVEAEIDLDLDFKRFPWDTQDLSITLYNPDEDSSKMKYEVETVGKDDSRIDEKAKIVGWHLEEDEPSVTEDSFMDVKDKYSMFTFSMEIQRMRFASTMKVFFPLTIMVIISFLALFIGAGAAVNRLTILTGTLLAATMFHLNASSSIPPIGYLTLSDKVFFCAYLSFLLNLILTVVILKFNEYKQEEKVKSAYSFALWFIPLFTIVSWGLAFAGIF